MPTLASYTAVGAGTATITAAVGNVSYVLEVMVFISATSITIAANNPLVISITNEDGSSNTGTLTAMVIPTNHTDGNVAWSSDDENVIIVTKEDANTATYTAVGWGRATVTASVGNVSNVLNLAVEGLVRATNIAIDQGRTITVTNTSWGTDGMLTATVTPTNHTDGNVSWVSDDTDKLTLSPATGSTTTYTAIGEGTVTVTASVGSVDTSIAINMVRAIAISNNAFMTNEGISIIGNVGATSVVSGTLSYAIVENSDNPFEIDDMGNISLSNGAELDYEETNQHVIEVSVSVGGFTDTFSVTIEVEDVLFFVERTGGDNPFLGDFGLTITPQFVDFYGDGNSHLYVMDNDDANFRMFFFSNTSSGWSDPQTNNDLSGLGSGLINNTGYSFKLFDYDSDNDWDIFFLDKNNLMKDIYYFENVSNTYTNQDNPLPFLNTIYDIAFHDLDGDSNVDLFYGFDDGTIAYYSNTNGGYVQHLGAANPFNGFDVGDAATLAFVDLDRDGDGDLVCGARDGRIYYFENRGRNTYIEQTGADSPFAGIDVGDISYPAFGDVDGDGLLDLVVGNLQGTLSYYRQE